MLAFCWNKCWLFVGIVKYTHYIYLKIKFMNGFFSHGCFYPFPAKEAAHKKAPVVKATIEKPVKKAARRKKDKK